MCALACAPAPPEPLRGAIVILLDTLRADAVSAYGGGDTTPHLDALAERGVLFENAVAYSSWTLPSVAALLTGTPPTRSEYDGTLTVSLVERLQHAGIHTAAITEGGFVSRHFGFDRGFDVFHEAEGAVRIRVHGAALHTVGAAGIEGTFGNARRWLGNNGHEPFFLLVHTYEPHVPYRRTHRARGYPRGELDETFSGGDLLKIRRGEISIGPVERAHLRRLYEGGVVAADRAVGGLLDELSQLGLAESTLVIVTSDHGEDLGERFASRAGDHGHSLYGELLRVPLIVYDPALPTPRRVGAQVRLVDVLPTVLERLGVGGTALTDASGTGSTLDGRSLWPLMAGREETRRLALSELDRHGARRSAISDGRFKLIRNDGGPIGQPPYHRSAPAEELYDLVADPDERSPRRGPDETSARDALARALDARAAEEGADFTLREIVDPYTRQRLQALGYLD